MAENQITWRPWQVDTRKLKEENKAKKRPKNAGSTAGTSKKSQSGHEHKDTKEEKTEETTPSQVENEVSEEVLGNTTEDPKWKHAGSAPSRGPRGYDAGNTNDSLFGGGGNRPIPDGLRRMARGGGRDDDDEVGGGAGGAGGGGGGEDGGDDDEGDGDGDDSLAYAATGTTTTTEVVEWPPDPRRQVTIKIKQGRFDEAHDLQLAILREESDARTAGTKLKEMVVAWSKMGENDLAQNLQLRYLESNTSYSWRVDRLEEMMKEWCIRRRVDRAVRLAGLYVNIYARGSDDEMVSATKSVMILTVKLTLELEWYIMKEELFCQVYFLLRNIPVYTHQTPQAEILKAAVMEQFNGIIADGKIEEARRLQQAHLSCLRNDRDTLFTTTETYIDRWLEIGNPDDAEGVLQEVLNRSLIENVPWALSENLVAFCNIWAARGAFDKVKSLLRTWLKVISNKYVETIDSLEPIVQEGIKDGAILPSEWRAWKIRE